MHEGDGEPLLLTAYLLPPTSYFLPLTSYLAVHEGDGQPPLPRLASLWDAVEEGGAPAAPHDDRGQRRGEGLEGRGLVGEGGLAQLHGDVQAAREVELLLGGPAVLLRLIGKK